MDETIANYEIFPRLNQVTRNVMLGLGAAAVACLTVGSQEFELVTDAQSTESLVLAAAFTAGAVAAGIVNCTGKAMEYLRDRITERHYRKQTAEG